MATREIQSGFFPVNKPTPSTVPEPPAPPVEGQIERYAVIGDKLRVNKHSQKIRIVPHNDPDRENRETEDFFTIEVVAKETDAPGIFMNIKGCLTEAG